MRSITSLGMRVGSCDIEKSVSARSKSKPHNVTHVWFRGFTKREAVSTWLVLGHGLVSDADADDPDEAVFGGGGCTHSNLVMVVSFSSRCVVS